MIYLKDEIETLMKRKSSDCNCNPCRCSEQKKALYFAELKKILKKVNDEYTVAHFRYPGSINYPTRNIQQIG